MIDAIYDNRGRIIYNGDKRICSNCNFDMDESLDNFDPNNYAVPTKKNRYEQIFSSETAYQMTSFLMGVIKRGTAKKY